MNELNGMFPSIVISSRCLNGLVLASARTVPHSQSGAVPMSSLSGVGQLGLWEMGEGGMIG
jgi:hypothetical protein